MQIKALLKCLTDNSLVRVEKIGSGNYYWAFPSDETANRKNRFNALKEKAESLENEIDQIACEVDAASMQRQFSVYL